MKNSTNQHSCQTVVADGISSLLSTVIATLMLWDCVLSSRRERGLYTNSRWCHQYYFFIFTHLKLEL